MDYLRLTDYFIYIGASAFLTIWVSRTLFRNGRAWLVSVFKEEGLADSVNRLLVVGFYLINFGAAALLINAGGAPGSVADMIQETVTRVGGVALVLGFMHFFNMFVLYVIRRSGRIKPPLPVNYNPYQPATGA
ncbi:MAG: hypothetical protein E6I61_07715 [Chloroflexi bacterium]|nr:MAG: hypothetical protein E6I71_01835 [Chloroflexota bacterium]TME40865.1 MAG: hypothetical protein E6I61_07715 [Chloroflexota bacterium]TME53178.1 MAG: hypothetical protein E6I53_04125 [Chloroflexota bacterium]